MSRKIRYGITGFGRFADKTIAPAIIKANNADLVAVQNRSIHRARDAAAAYGIPLAFESVRDLAQHPEVEAVFIVSANSLHCEEAILAAQAAKHVLCEKPMALNATECEQMIAECSLHKVKLSVGHMIRLSPLIQRMKQLIQSGDLGIVTRAEANFIYDGRLSKRAWLTDRRIAGGGPIFDIGVHCLDTLRFILGDEVVSINGELKPHPSGEATETTAQLLLRFSRGTIASIFCSYDSPLRQSYLEILGTEARLSVIDFTLSSRKAELKMELRNGELLREKVDIPDLYEEEVIHFSQCILNDEEPLLSGKNGLLNQQILDRAMNL